MSQPTMVIRVLIIDRVRIFREMLMQALARPEDFDVIDAGPGMEQGLSHLGEDRPDVILVHTTFPEGITTLRAVVEAPHGARVIAVGVAETEDDIIACAEAGAAGYVSRDDSIEDLVGTIRSVALGEMRCSPRIAAMLIKRVATLAAQHHARALTVHLTRREDEIVRLIDEGLSNKEIAHRLSIEVRTVKNHVHNILEKLQVHRRGEAAALFRELRPPRTVTVHS